MPNDMLYENKVIYETTTDLYCGGVGTGAPPIGMSSTLRTRGCPSLSTASKSSSVPFRIISDGDATLRRELTAFGQNRGNCWIVGQEDFTLNFPRCFE